MNLIEQEASKGVLQPNQNVLKVLQKLHPPRRHVTTSEMIQGSSAETNPVVFESINHSAIYHSTMQTRGSGGPSGLDAANFRRMACSTKFKQVSESFCTTVSEIARKLCCEEIDPIALETYTACRTIALHRAAEQSTGSEEDRKEGDKKLVRSFLEELELSYAVVEKTTRLGKKTGTSKEKDIPLTEHHRPLMVTLNNSSEVETVMKNLRKLKNAPDELRILRISPDCSMKGSEEVRNLIQRAKNLTEHETGDFMHIVRGTTIIKVKQERNETRKRDEPQHYVHQRRHLNKRQNDEAPTNNL